MSGSHEIETKALLKWLDKDYDGAQAALANPIGMDAAAGRSVPARVR